MVPLLLLLLMGAVIHYLGRGSEAAAESDQIRLDHTDRQVLRQQGRFYATLSPADQARFEKRIVDLVYEKDWIGRGVQVSREMKVRIAAAIAQVTFGFEDLLLLHFRRVIIHPGAYRNPRTGRQHIGEVVPGAGTLVFSWQHFLEGFDTPDDARNVGVHEVAHALWFENHIPNAEDDFLPPRLLRHWEKLAGEEILRIKAGQSGLFRAYAGTNQAEFFAVAVEYFFEQPLIFSERLPSLYGTLCNLLRQDPARTAHQ